MKIYGQFRDNKNRLIDVTIQSNKGIEEIEIGDDILFDDSPIIIKRTIEDMFQHEIIKSCTINLKTKRYIGNLLFADNARDVNVIVERNGDCLFYGYVTPNTYNQPFQSPIDSFTIEAVDVLGTLQYYNYNNCTLSNYEDKKTNSDTLTAKEIILNMLADYITIPDYTLTMRETDEKKWNDWKKRASIGFTITTEQYNHLKVGGIFCLKGYITDKDEYEVTFWDCLKLSKTLATGKCIKNTTSIYYDNSKGIDENSLSTLFDDISFNDINMYGDEFDDILTQSEALEEILKYLNLHIIQEGKDFYIFDWDTLKSGNTDYYSINGNGRKTVSLTTTSLQNNFASNDTNISIDDVYKQIQINCELNKQDTLIKNPLDSDYLTSLYSGKQLYMTEYISEGSGDHANDAFNAMVKGNSTSYKDCKTIDWFIQTMSNPYWKMNIGSSDTIESIFEKEGDKYINQYKVPKYLKDNQLIPCIFRMGKIEIEKGNVTDNSPISKIDMNDYLYISVNGNETDTESGHSPTDTLLQDKAPIIEYIDNSNGGVYSPTDDNTINYLVFSGKLLLQPIVYESGKVHVSRTNNYTDIFNNGAAKTMYKKSFVPMYDGIKEINLLNLVTSDNNEEGRYYTRKFFNTKYVNDEPRTYMNAASLQPWTTDKSAHGYKYKYSASGEGDDKFSKLPILECELIIGDKRLIEKDMDMYGNSTFEWVKVGEEPTETIDGVSYPITTFSLGVNPKIDDYIIGTEFNLQNTIKYQENIDAVGTAIPIKRSDKLNGKVTFRILGTINTLWNDITRRHPSFWRHTNWTENARFILAHTENIIIKDFECKIYTNNGMNENNFDGDLIYMSNESDNFINTNEINFSFMTQLSSAECMEKGINQSVNMNAVIETNENLPLVGLYNHSTSETAKAEEHYINQYYLEYSQPKMILETTIHQDISKYNDIYNWNVINDKTFISLGSETDLKYNTITLKLKET